MKATMDAFLKNGKGLLLAYDQGFEHGPSTDFNEKNIDPNYILDIALKGQFTGVVFHKGNEPPTHRTTSSAGSAQSSRKAWL